MNPTQQHYTELGERLQRYAMRDSSDRFYHDAEFAARVCAQSPDRLSLPDRPTVSYVLHLDDVYCGRWEDPRLPLSGRLTTIPGLTEGIMEAMRCQYVGAEGRGRCVRTVVAGSTLCALPHSYVGASGG